MISFDDIKPGKLLVLGKMLVGKRIVLQINSYPQELETEFAIKVIRVVNRNFIERWSYFTKKDLLKNNKNQSLMGWSKPRINEIFDWHNLKLVNKMNT